MEVKFCRRSQQGEAIPLRLEGWGVEEVSCGTRGCPELGGVPAGGGDVVGGGYVPSVRTRCLCSEPPQGRLLHLGRASRIGIEPEAELRAG